MKKPAKAKRKAEQAPVDSRPVVLLQRLELQGERWWTQFHAGCALAVVDGPGKLLVYHPERPGEFLCQMTRWAEDAGDPGWFEGPWLRAWIGGHATQVRAEDVAALDNGSAAPFVLVK